MSASSSLGLVCLVYRCFHSLHQCREHRAAIQAGSGARVRQLLKPDALEPRLQDRRRPGLRTREERAEQPRPGTARSEYRSEQANT
ncbi:unnamed protein product [Rangifer tarandus platyrhynchus]|uniref:Uncharacterized protein n=1 Tax=Rangifer tarandus platyrhynchus TaxID=3082113 RepID=A0AC59Y7W2_RANTA